jgi:hypothetical protein
MLANQFSHSTTQLVQVPANYAFDYLKNPLRVGEWALGCLNSRPSSIEGLYKGIPLYNPDAVGYYRVKSNEEWLIVDILIGTREIQFPQMSLRIVPETACGLPANSCYVTLSAWKGTQRTTESWERLIALHEAGIWIIKGVLESSYSASS